MHLIIQIWQLIPNLISITVIVKVPRHQWLQKLSKELINRLAYWLNMVIQKNNVVLNWKWIGVTMAVP